MMRWLVAAGAGVVSAGVLLGAGHNPAAAFFLIFIMPLPLYLAGLGLGTASILVAGACAALVMGIAGGALGALYVVLLLAGPAAWLVRQALLSRSAPDGSLEWYPPGLLVMWLTLFGAGWLLLAMVWVGSGEGDIRSTLAAVLEAPLQALFPALSDQEARSAAANSATIVLGVAVMGGQITHVISGALAQGLLLRFGRNRRPSPDFAALELPPWMGMALAVDAAVALIAPGQIGFAAQNLLFVLALPYFLLGLAVIHTLTRRWSARTPALVIIYATLIFMGWVAIPIAALGLIEQWSHLRRRMAPGPSGQEDE